MKLMLTILVWYDHTCPDLFEVVRGAFRVPDVHRDSENTFERLKYFKPTKINFNYFFNFFNAFN